MGRLKTGVVVVLAAMCVGQIGCAVPQKPGRGSQKRLVEPSTQTAYWLYLPEDYVERDGQHPRGERWPMVVTLHGLRPYDNAEWQCREWQEEADRYGLIVVAPDLRTCDSLTMQLPLREAELSYVRNDEKGLLAIMSEVFRRTNADPHRVLMTSFSSGGYLAHYLVNRYPQRFSVLAVRGSNFNRQLLQASQVPRYRDMPIGIFFGQHDIPICRRENMDAIEWYRSHRFDVEARMVQGLGHERRPQFAAALFARVADLTPKSPPDLGSVVMLDVPVGQEDRTEMRGRMRTKLSAATPSTGIQRRTSTPLQIDQEDRDILFAERHRTAASPKPAESPTVVPPRASYRPALPQKRPQQKPRQGSPTPKRPHMQPYNAPLLSEPRVPDALPPTVPPADADPLTERSLNTDDWIRVVRRDGTQAPMWMTLQLELPSDLRDDASVLWTNNDEPIGANGTQARILFRKGGSHKVTAFIVTADDRTLTASHRLYIPVPTSQPAGT